MSEAEIKSLIEEIKEYITMLNDPEDKDRKVDMARESLERIGLTEAGHRWHFQNSQLFFEPYDGSAFDPHPLAWDSITYRSKD